MTVPPAVEHRIPAAYWLWLAGTSLSLAGNQALAFGLAWSASASGGVLAGFVLTAVLLPRVLLLLVGGAVADRAGVRRVLLAGDGVMLAVTLGLVLVLQVTAPTAALLLGTALVVGTVDAFYLPASSTMPRRLAPAAALPRAMAARQLAGQLALSCGGPLGGVLVGLAGLAAVALADAASFAAVLVVLLALRLPDEGTGSSAPGPRGLARPALDGLRVVLADRPLRLSLLLLSAAALVLLPASSLLLPLLGLARGWTAGQTGAVVGAVAVGTALVAVAVLARGTAGRPGVTGPAGLVLAAAGLAGLALPLPPSAGSRSGPSSAWAPASSPRTSGRCSSAAARPPTSPACRPSSGWRRTCPCWSATRCWAPSPTGPASRSRWGSAPPSSPSPPAPHWPRRRCATPADRPASRTRPTWGVIGT